MRAGVLEDLAGGDQQVDRPGLRHAGRRQLRGQQLAERERVVRRRQRPQALHVGRMRCHCGDYAGGVEVVPVRPGTVRVDLRMSPQTASSISSGTVRPS